MPSWTAENEVKLLLTVIKTNNPKISRTTWEEIASAMGKGYTYESVRQKYQNLKRDSEASDGKSALTKDKNKPTPSTSTTTKPTPSASTKKRKAASPTTDDEEDFTNPNATKIRKLKAEKDGMKVEGGSCVGIKNEIEDGAGGGGFGDEIINEV